MAIYMNRDLNDQFFPEQASEGVFDAQNADNGEERSQEKLDDEGSASPAEAALEAEEHEDWEAGEDGEAVEAKEPEKEDFASYSKATLLERLKTVTQAENPMEVNKTVQEIKKYFELLIEKEYKKALDRFVEEGNSEIDFKQKPDTVKDEFFKTFNDFKKRRSAYIQALNNQKEENLQKKREMLEQMKAITEDAEMRGRVKAFKQLQSEWKKIGHVPKHEIENLWRAYDFYVKKFYDNLHLYSEFRELDRKKNLESKQELCQKLEYLAQFNELKALDKQLRKIQNDWHQIGPVPDDEHEALINRFNQAMANAEARKEALETAIRQEQEKNLEAKQAIIDKIRAFQEFDSEKPRDWVDKNNELEALIKEWKAIGHVPYDKKAQLAHDFKEAVRHFNYRKNQFFKRKKQERSQTLQRKEAILQRTRELLEPEDFKKAKNEVLDLQKEWKELGIVPSKRGEEMWNEFREVCDEFFSRLANYYSQQEVEEQKHLEAKQQLCEKAEQYAEEGTDDPETLVKTLQNEWEQIGFVPYQYKDQIRQRFNQALEKLLKTSEAQLHTDPELLTFKIKIDGLKEQNKTNQLSTEERKLNKKLKQNEEEVRQLEQNILFFNSSSNNAQKLVEEYQQKIEQLKEEAQQIREKLDIINEA